jgi:antirestriction protein
MTNSAHANTATDSTPAIYVANLSAYNEGRLVGKWIKIDSLTDADMVRAEIQEMLDNTGGEEYAIHDYDNLPSTGGEWPDIDELVEIAHAVNEHGYNLIKGFVDYFGASQLGEFEDFYNGTFSDEEDFARDLVDQCYDLDKMMGSLASYFDYEAFARDLFMGDYVSVDVPEGVAVFRSC